VSNRVTFAGPQQDPRPFYGAADVFVLPTLYDALSNAVLEALACGLPVITSDRCGAAELVTEHGAGIVCGARDVDALAQAMNTMLASAARSQMARNALAAVADLTPPAMAARLVALYERLLG
jgi:UDP-glucose:(heptosyl)LPS alpha-1,3-glucosyltransferase